MSSAPNEHQARLAELLHELHLNPAEAAVASKVSQKTFRRALAGAQTSAVTRSRIIKTINQRRTQQGLSGLQAAEIFPAG